MSGIGNDNQQYSIRHIAAQTGVNPVTLRAWERRYGLIKPQRTPKGHRLYTEQDIHLVKNILFILSKGFAISKVKDLLANEQIHLLQADDYQSLIPTFEEIAKSLDSFNHIQLENELTTLYTLYSPEQFADEITPRLFAYLEDKALIYSDFAISQKTFLLDTLNAKLYQYLYQNIHKNDKFDYLILGYRTAMIQTRVLHGLMLANIIKAYEHRVDFISGVSSYEEIIQQCKVKSNRRVIIFTSPESFYIKQLMATLSKNAIENCRLHLTHTGKPIAFNLENNFLLPQKFSSIYGVLNMAN